MSLEFVLITFFFIAIMLRGRDNKEENLLPQIQFTTCMNLGNLKHSQFMEKYSISLAYTYIGA